MVGVKAPCCPDEDRETAGYDQVASAYCGYIEKLSAPLADCAVTLAGLKKGDRVLDVGTGSAIAARYAARKVGPSGFAMGIDLSEGMLVAAGEASRQEGLTNVEFRRMDAETLDLPDESFDAVISLCAVSHFSDLAAALAQMVRVLRRGRRLVVATGYGRPPLGYGLTRFAVRRVLSSLKSLPRPQRWAPHMILGFIAQRVPEFLAAADRPTDVLPGRLEAFARAAGLREIATRWCGHVLTFDSAADYWEAQTAIVTRVREQLLALSASRVATLRDEFLAATQRVLDQGGKLQYPYGAFYVTGVRA